MTAAYPVRPRVENRDPVTHRLLEEGLVSGRLRQDRPTLAARLNTKPNARIAECRRELHIGAGSSIAQDDDLDVGALLPLNGMSTGRVRRWCVSH